MGKNTGIPYEKLVQHIYRQIVNCNGIDTIDVQHNVMLKGKTTSHQIDVYWEFVLGGILYRTVIQAKDWAAKVPQGAMLTFKAVLDDLPNGTKGIFIAKTGYQSGAIDVAKANGISIHTFRPAAEENWNGQIPMISVALRLRTPFFHQPHFRMPPDWAKHNPQVAEIMSDLDPRSLVVDNETGENWTVNRLITTSCDTCGVPPKEYTKEFHDAYLQPYGTDIKIKIKEFTGFFGYQTRYGDKIKIQVDQLVGYILRDVTDGKIEIFDDNATLLRNEAQRNG